MNNYSLQQQALQMYINYCRKQHKDINTNIKKALNELDPKKEYIIRRFYGIHCVPYNESKICDTIKVSKIYVEQTIMMETINIADICEKEQISEYIAFKNKLN